MEPLDNLYFNWLCAQVKAHHDQNYADLMIILHRTEFTWVIPADSHRADEGIELRLAFFRETGVDPDSDWEEQPCSILELLIAFARRAAFQTSINHKAWFWEMIANLKLDEFRRISGNDEAIIKDILDTFIWRQYDFDGEGGLFPISRTNTDQRDIEIWYQFHKYIDDRGIV